MDAKLSDMKGQLNTFFSDIVAEEHIWNSVRNPFLSSIHSLPDLPEILLELKLDLVAKTTYTHLKLTLGGEVNILSHFLKTSQHLLYIISPFFCQHKKVACNSIDVGMNLGDVLAATVDLREESWGRLADW